MLHTIPLGIVSSTAAAYLIEQSLLFDGAAYLSRTPSVAGNRLTWTFSCWAKRAKLGANSVGPLFGAGPDGSHEFMLRFNNSDQLYMIEYPNSTAATVTTTATFKDTSAWYHIVLAVDTTQATSTDRIKMWVNGVLQTLTSTTYYSLNYAAGYVNATNTHQIGAFSVDSYYFDGLMALPILVDGAALDPTSFGEEDADGYWNPIEFAGTTTVHEEAIALASTGTNIGNATNNGGLAAAFDGVVNTSAACANATGVTLYVGKDWGSGVTKTISSFFMSSPSDDGWSGAAPVTIRLEGSSDNFSSDINTLHEITGITFGASTVTQTVDWVTTQTTAYRYHRWVITGASGGSRSVGEITANELISVADSYGTSGGAYDFAVSSHFGNDVSGAGVTPDLTVATSWSGTNLAQYGFSAGNITKNTLSQNAIRTAGVWGGDFSITLDLQDGDGTFGTNEEFFGFASASDTFDDTKTASTITGTNYYIQPATDSATLMTYYRNGAAVSTFAVVPGDTIKWERSGTTVTLYVNTVSRFSETTSLTGLVYGFIQLYKTNESADNVTTTGTFSNSFIDSGFVAADQVSDTPTDDVDLGIGNHVTFTPYGRFTDITLSEANTVMTNASGDVRNCELSIAPESGKFIFEINPSTAGNIGMAFARNTYNRASNANWGNSLDAIRMFRESNTNLRTYYNTGSGVNVNIGVTIDNTNDRIVYAIDADNRYLWLGLWDASASAYIWLDGSGGVTGAPATGTNPTYTLPGTGAIYIAGETVSGQPITLYAAADKWLGSGVTGFVALATQNMDAASYSTPITGSFVGNAAVTQAWVYLGAAPNTAGTSTINGNTITWGTHAVAMATGFRLITTSSSYNSTGSNTFSIAVLGSDAGGAIQGGTGATTQGRAR
jgi:hypothetical protein